MRWTKKNLRKYSNKHMISWLAMLIGHDLWPISISVATSRQAVINDASDPIFFTVSPEHAATQWAKYHHWRPEQLHHVISQVVLVLSDSPYYWHTTWDTAVFRFELSDSDSTGNTGERYGKQASYNYYTNIAILHSLLHRTAECSHESMSARDKEFQVGK